MATNTVIDILIKAKDEASKTLSSVSKSLKDTGATSEEVSRSLKIAGGALITVGTAGLLAMKDWADAASDAQNDVIRANVMLQNIAKTSKDASLTFQKLSEATQKVGKDMIQLGFDDETAMLSMAKFLATTNDVAMAQKALGAAADIARFKNIDLETATTAVNMALMGSGRILKQLGIEVEDTKNKNEVLEAVMARVGGQATAYADTYAGSMERMRVTTDNLKEALGDRLLPALATVMDGITAFIQKINELDPRVIDIAVKVFAIGTALALIIGPILLLIGFLPSLAAGFGVVGTIITWVTGVVTAIIGVLGGPLTLVIIAVMALVALFALAWKNNWLGIRDVVGKVVDWFKDVAWPTINTVFNWIKDAVSWVAQRWIDRFNAIRNSVESVVNAIHNVISAAENMANRIKSGLKIPGFQTGGVVPGPIGSPVLATVHGGEEVIPTTRREAKGGGGGITIEVNIGMFAGTETEMRNVATQLYQTLVRLAQAQRMTVAEFMGA